MDNKKTRIGLITLIAAGSIIIIAYLLIQRQTPPEQVLIPTYWPTTGWQTSTPEEQGLDSVKLAETIETIQEQNILVNSLMIIRNGKIVLDTNFYNPYDGKYPHDLASVTKSIMTTLIGIAAGQGKIELDEPILTYFSDRSIANLDNRKEKLTVRHLAGMVNGMESGCLEGDLPTLATMYSNPDWVQWALDRPMVKKPGKEFCYDSPGMHLLSAILQQTTGMTTEEYARQYLFGPLGIKDVIWETDPQGSTRGWGDLHLYPQDAAKIGYLFLYNGVWENQQLVPADWVEQAVKAHVDAGEDEYGYGWWVMGDTFGAVGRGGQNIFVIPSLAAIVVTTGGTFTYDQIDALLTASVVDASNPLMPNPEGNARLQAALDGLVREPPPLPRFVVPEIAHQISGATYVFDPNPILLENVMVDFSDPAELKMPVNVLGSDTIWIIGLDNQYRYSQDGLLQRGYWKDDQTFMVEVFDIGITNRVMTFTGDQIRIEAEGMTILGTRVSP